MECKRVSVIIPSYNHGHFVTFAVESALAQTYKDTEIVVVDDGSTDNTREVLAPYMGRIKYIYQENRGLSAARNTGIRAASGDFIALLDADDMWVPEKLALQMKIFSDYPDTGLVSCGNVPIDGGGQQVAPGTARGTGRLRFRDLLWGNCVAGGSNAVIRRGCFNEVGLFDENLRSSEDWDMWLRIAWRYPVRFASQILMKVRVSADSMSAAKNADTMLVNDLRVLRKLFADPETKVNAYDRGRAYAHRYGAAAWARYNVGSQREAYTYIRKAFLANPLHFVLQKGLPGLAVRIAIELWRDVKLVQGEK
jgi:glycosyltransferase involved in cell wall biosynthesis